MTITAAPLDDDEEPPDPDGGDGDDVVVAEETRVALARASGAAACGGPCPCTNPDPRRDDDRIRPPVSCIASNCTDLSEEELDRSAPPSPPPRFRLALPPGVGVLSAPILFVDRGVVGEC